MTTTAAIYLRVSTEDQAADDKTSLADQERKCRAWALAQTPELDVVAVFTDDGASGSLSMGERPAGADLLEQASLAQFGQVIVAKLDRFTRSVRHGAADMDTLNGYGVGVTFIDMGVDTSTPAGELMLNMMIAFAAFERVTITGRMVDGRKGRAGLGMWPGGARPYGLTTDEEAHLVMDEAQNLVLQRIFTLVAAGQGSKAVADMLNLEGVESARKGGTWSHVTIQNAIRNESYKTGVVERKQGGERFTFDAPRLIAPALWNAANHALDDLKATRKQQKRAAVQKRYALSGHLDHLHGDEDDSQMTGRYRATTRLGRYYACAQAKTCPGLGTDHAGQTLKTIPAAKAEAALLIWGLNVLDDPSALAGWVAAYDRAELGAEKGDEAKRLTTALKLRDKLEGQQAEYKAALFDGTITATELKDHLAALGRKVANNEGLIERLSTAQGRVDALQVSIQMLKTSGSHIMDEFMPGKFDPRQEGAPITDDTGQGVGDSLGWDDMRDMLRAHAVHVLTGIAGMEAGRPKAGAKNTAHDLAPWAQEWAQAFVERFQVKLQVGSQDIDTWSVDGVLPQKLTGPGTQAKREHVPTVRFRSPLN